jgi:hypothetical protein
VLDAFARGEILFDSNPMRKTRTIVAVTLLATALCADRRLSSAASAAEGSRTEAGPVVRGFAQRLTVSLRRVVSAVQIHQGRQEGAAQVVWLENAPEQTCVRASEGVPFQFRLPPPVV